MARRKKIEVKYKTKRGGWKKAKCKCCNANKLLREGRLTMDNPAVRDAVESYQDYFAVTISTQKEKTETAMCTTPEHIRLPMLPGLDVLKKSVGQRNGIGGWLS